MGLKELMNTLLPKNKLARLAINIAFIPLWATFLTFVFWPIFWRLILWYDDRFSQYLPNLYSWSINPLFLNPLNICIVSIPIIIITRYIWFGRLKPRLKITTSIDD